MMKNASNWLRNAVSMVLIVTLASIADDASANASNPSTAVSQSFPRLMGMQIGEPDYHRPEYQEALSRLDIVILGFYPGWQRLRTTTPIRDAVKEIKRRAPNAVIGQYTLMNESRDENHKWAGTERDRIAKINEMNWWLRNAHGNKVQWTSEYGHWEVNFTQWARADPSGKRFPEWLANRDYRTFFQPVPEFRIWYVDNVMFRPRVRADWNLDGVDDDINDQRLQQAFRAGYAAWWQEIRRLDPGILIMGNSDGDLSEPEYVGQLNGAFLEGLMGKDWSIERRLGWSRMMTHYRAVKKNLRDPAIVGFNVWGDQKDFRFFRYAFASCLLDDGFFSFTDLNAAYTGTAWFDEYDFKLGKAQTSPPSSAWQNGVWRRDFENGAVFVNPSDKPASVALERPYKRMAGRQDPGVNNGATTLRLTIAPKDGLVLQRLP